jgi:DNA end-binding protein Ku
MPSRPSWQGHSPLVVGDLPGCSLSGDRRAETVRFNLINPATKNRIRMQTLDAGTGEEVRSDL